MKIVPFENKSIGLRLDFKGKFLREEKFTLWSVTVVVGISLVKPESEISTQKP